LAIIGVLLVGPGHAFGSDAAGVPLAMSGQLALGSGQTYVVQPGDTLNSIAARVNPQNPAAARAALLRETFSPYVFTGEHLQIP
jgi:Tfp pilus assembly protein FimV